MEPKQVSLWSCPHKRALWKKWANIKRRNKREILNKIAFLIKAHERIYYWDINFAYFIYLFI